MCYIKCRKIDVCPIDMEYDTKLPDFSKEDNITLSELKNHYENY